MGKMSREKGKRGEREWASFCREHGYRNVRRSVQYSGRAGTAADCIGLPGIHQEIKRVEKLNLYDAVNQAVRDSNAEDKGNIPIVAHRKNDCEWLVTMRAEDWFALYIEWDASFSLLAELPGEPSDEEEV